MSSWVRVTLGTLALVCCSVGVAFADFDKPLTEFQRIASPNVGVVMAGQGTADVGRPFSFTIDVPGTPTAAYVYWSGETRRDFDDPSHPLLDPDPSLSVKTQQSGNFNEVVGSEIGRRSQLLDVERFDGGNEIVMGSSLPIEWFAANAMNIIEVTNFNEANPNNDDGIVEGEDRSSYYRRQYGVVVVVFFDRADSHDREVIALQGADVANADKYFFEQFPDQQNGQISCFTFSALSCDATARLRFGVGGVVEIISRDPANGDFTPTVGSGERTFFKSGSGIAPASLLDIADADALENDQLIDTNQSFFRGRKIAVYDGEVSLKAGDTWACFQHELDRTTTDRYSAQNFTTHVATLDLDRQCEAVSGCLTRSPGFWGNHPSITEEYLPLESCGLLIDSADPRTRASATEDICYNGCDTDEARTSPSQMQLVRQCMAANLNIAATLAGGGSCTSERPDLLDRIEECCNGVDSICNGNSTKRRIEQSGCIAYLDAFNNSEDTLADFGPFVRPRANSCACEQSRGNGWVNLKDANDVRRDYGPRKGNNRGETDPNPMAQPDPNLSTLGGF